MRLPKDKALIAKSLPIYLLPSTENVSSRQRDKNAFGPELRNLAIWHDRGAHDECDIDAALADERNVLAQSAFGNLDAHVGIALAIGPYQFPQEARSHRREDSDAQYAILASSRRPGSLDRLVELNEGIACAVEESGSGGGDAHASRKPLKKRHAERILE